MCPVGTVASDIADTEPELRQVTAEVIASWVDPGTRYLASRGLSPADARAAMYALLNALEGGFLLAGPSARLSRPWQATPPTQVRTWAMVTLRIGFGVALPGAGAACGGRGCGAGW